MMTTTMREEENDIASGRWTAWARHAACTTTTPPSSSSSTSCPEDYFSVNGQKTKVRVVEATRSNTANHGRRQEQQQQQSTSSGVVTDRFATFGGGTTTTTTRKAIVRDVSLSLLTMAIIIAWRLGGSRIARLFRKPTTGNKQEQQATTTTPVNETTSSQGGETSSSSSKSSSAIIIMEHPTTTAATRSNAVPLGDEDDDGDLPVLISEKTTIGSAPEMVPARSSGMVGNEYLATNNEKNNDNSGHAVVDPAPPRLLAAQTCAAAAAAAGCSSSCWDIRQVEARAQEMTTAIRVAQTSLRQAGHQVDAKDLIPFAVAQLQKAHDLSQGEYCRRRYNHHTLMAATSEGHGRRQQQEETRIRMDRHGTTARSIRQDDDAQWMDRIKKGCNELLEEVERSIIRILLVAACIRLSLWMRPIFETASGTTSIWNALAMTVCNSCSIDNNYDAMNAFLGSSSPLFWMQSSCWMSCASRCLCTVLGVYMALQLRLLLPALIREMATTLVFGSACLMAVSLNYVSAYWYFALLLMMVAYLGAHAQFFLAKRRLQRAYPGKNPTSHAVNEALDLFETHRRLYAVAPIVFGAIHVGALVFSNAMATRDMVVS